MYSEYKWGARWENENVFFLKKEGNEELTESNKKKKHMHNKKDWFTLECLN